MATSSPSRNVDEQPHVLISYSYGDHEFARKLAGALRRDRITPWIDEVEMAAGVSLVSRVSLAVRPVDFVVPVISAASVTSDWAKRELATVMAREFNARRVNVLPARIDGSALPDYLVSHACADFHTRGWNQAYGDLKAGIQRRATPVPPVMRPAPVARPAPPSPRAKPADDGPAGTKVVFVSYDHESDGYYKDILVTWSKHPDFVQLLINDQPVTVPVDSEDAEPLKRLTSTKINAATGFLCVVGAKTSTNSWMEWELKKAVELGKRIIAVRITRDCAVPEVLSDAGATCAMSFTFEGIRRAIDEAYGGCSFD